MSSVDLDSRLNNLTYTVVRTRSVREEWTMYDNVASLDRTSYVKGNWDEAKHQYYDGFPHTTQIYFSRIYNIFWTYLIDLQLGYINFCCFLREWDSRAREIHYSKKQ